MSNSSQKRNGGIQEKTVALLQNRMGIAPSAVSYTLTNEIIEDVVEKIFRDNGVDVDGENIAIRVVWNRKYDQVIKNKGKNADIPPFFVYVGVKLSKEEKKGGKYNISGGGFANERLRALAAMTADAGKKVQFNMIGKDDLNNAVAIFKNNDKIKWDIANKKAGVMKADLDTDLVIAMALCLDTEEGQAYQWNVDFTSQPHIYGGDEQKFSITVTKEFRKQNFKKTKNDLSKYLR